MGKPEDAKENQEAATLIDDKEPCVAPGDVTHETPLEDEAPHVTPLDEETAPVITIEEDEVAVVKPLDGGWGWFVVAGLMIHMYLPAALVRSFTFLYLPMVDRFQQSDTLTSITLAITLSSYFAFSFMSGSLSNRYKARHLALTGSVFFVSGLILSAFATSIYMVYLGFGLFVGIGMSLMLAPGMVITNQYFKEQKSKAFGLANVAKGISSFTMPPFMEFLLGVYGWSGALLVFSGLSLHSFVGSLLYRPLEDNFPKTRKRGILDVKTSTVKVLNHATSVPELDTLLTSQQQQKDNDESKDEKRGLNGESNPDEENESNTRSSAGKTKKNPLLHLSLLKHFRFMCFAIGLFFFNLGLNSMVFLAPLGKENGYSASQITISVTVFGVSDLVGAMLVGYIFDLKVLKKKRYHLYYVLFFVNALTSFGIGLAKDYILLVLFVVLKGITLSIFWMRVPIMADFIGDDKVASGVAITSPLFGVGNLCGPIVGGLLKDNLNSYAYVMHYAGICGVLCALVMCMGSFHKKCSAHEHLNHKETVIAKTV